MDSFPIFIAFSPGKLAKESLQLVSAYICLSWDPKTPTVSSKNASVIQFFDSSSRPGADGFRCSGGWTCLCAQRAGGDE